MKPLFLFLVFIALTPAAHSQTIEWQMPKKDTVYEAKYNKLKAVYVKKRQSESYKKFSKLNDAFLEKVNFKDHFKEIEMRTIMEWIKANLAKTKFASYEEAEKEWKIVREAVSEHSAESSEYYDLMREYRKNGDMEIVKAVMMDVQKEYPDRE